MHGRHRKIQRVVFSSPEWCNASRVERSGSLPQNLSDFRSGIRIGFSVYARLLSFFFFLFLISILLYFDEQNLFTVDRGRRLGSWCTHKIRGVETGREENFFLILIAIRRQSDRSSPSLTQREKCERKPVRMREVKMMNDGGICAEKRVNLVC